MAFTDNADRHSFPHRRSTGYETMTIGPSEITLGHLDGSILKTPFEDGIFQARRKRREIRTFIWQYDLLESDEWKVIWDFYKDKAEHELYYFYINLYYIDTFYDNEWIGVNFSQKINLRNWDVIFGTFSINLVENLQATATWTPA